MSNQSEKFGNLATVQLGTSFCATVIATGSGVETCQRCILSSVPTATRSSSSASSTHCHRLSLRARRSGGHLASLFQVAGSNPAPDSDKNSNYTSFVAFNIIEVMASDPS